MKRFNGFQLKLFMAMLMVLDHLDYIPGFLPPWWSEIFHVITRCVAPFFAYMAVEGFIHTRSRLKYNGRLFLWAGIMFAGNFGLNHLLNADSLTVYNNIFITLAMGVLALNVWCYPVKSTKLSPKVILALRILIAVPVTVYACVAYEGSNAVVPFMLICYFLRSVSFTMRTASRNSSRWNTPSSVLSMSRKTARKLTRKATTMLRLPKSGSSIVTRAG